MYRCFYTSEHLEKASMNKMFPPAMTTALMMKSRFCKNGASSLFTFNHSVFAKDTSL